MISGGNNEAEVACLKNSAKTICKRGRFVLHKLHSNNPRLEKLNECDSDKNNSELSYGKQQLRSKSCKTKTLRIHWNKARDKFEIRFPTEKFKTTKSDI